MKSIYGGVPIPQRQCLFGEFVVPPLFVLYLRARRTRIVHDTAGAVSERLWFG